MAPEASEEPSQPAKLGQYLRRLKAGPCRFPGCGKPRKLNRHGASRWCGGHEKQWQKFRDEERMTLLRDTSRLAAGLCKEPGCDRQRVRKKDRWMAHCWVHVYPANRKEG